MKMRGGIVVVFGLVSCLAGCAAPDVEDTPARGETNVGTAPPQRLLSAGGFGDTSCGDPWGFGADGLPLSFGIDSFDSFGSCSLTKGPASLGFGGGEASYGGADQCAAPGCSNAEIRQAQSECAASNPDSLGIHDCTMYYHPTLRIRSIGYTCACKSEPNGLCANITGGVFNNRC